MFDMQEKATRNEPVPAESGSPLAQLRSLAAEGRLAETARRVPASERKRLNGAAYQLAFPIVFHRLTRALEYRRGHHACAAGVHCLEADCLDRFHNDVEAVVDDMLRNANARIHNLEAWVVPRLRAATVNAHRRRRGERGALQRPRLPRWLDAELGHDPWLGRLAVGLLEWVGVPATAGISPWPLDRWSDLRAEATGDWTGSDSATVQRDIDRVLAAMRRRPVWFAENVERPLGAKTPALAPAPVDGRVAPDPPGLALVEAYELDEARLTELAASAIEAIRRRAVREPNIHAVTRAVVLDLFGRSDFAAAQTMPPHAVPEVDEQISTIVGDPERLNSIVATVLDIIRETSSPERRSAPTVGGRSVPRRRLVRQD